MKKTTLFFLMPCLLFSGCAKQVEKESQLSSPALRWTAQKSTTTASLRGLSVVDSSVVWASGSGGTCLRTTDGGATWQVRQVPDADSIDFRDIAAFDSETAYLLSAGMPAHIYKTMDGGDTWLLQYENTTPDIFFDAFDFWDENHGIAMSDPVKGHFILIRTEDGGVNWEAVPEGNIPAPVEGEAGFAASGTGLAVQGERYAWFATGGMKARIFRSSDRGLHWEVADTPIISGKPSTGIFSIAFSDTLHGVGVGGDYLHPESTTKNVCYTTDGGVTWQLVDDHMPGGYRSCVAYQQEQGLFMTVGPSGSDYSADMGKTWIPVDSTGYHSIRFTSEGQIGWATGSAGRVAKIEMQGPDPAMR